MSQWKILTEAVQGEKNKILKILQGNVNVQIRDAQGDTLLHLAFRNENCSQAELIEILKILLNRGIDINSQNRSGKTILHLATERRMKDVIDICLSKPNLRVDHQIYLPHFAIEEESHKFQSQVKSEMLKLFVKKSSRFIDWMVTRGFDFFHTKNAQGYSALYLANNYGVLYIVLTLLKRVDDLPSVEKDQSPLLCALLEKETISKTYLDPKILKAMDPNKYESQYVYEIVKIILEKNKTYSDETLALAIYSSMINNHQMKVIEMLLERINNADHYVYGKSLIQTFMDNYPLLIKFLGIENLITILHKLISKGANINDHDENNETVALKWFRRHSNLATLRLLKDWGAVFNVQTTFGTNFFYLAFDAMEIEWNVTFLIENGADVNTKDINGKTPLHLIKQADTIIEILFNAGALVDALDYQGRSPLYDVIIRESYYNERVEATFEELLMCGADIQDPKVYTHALNSWYLRKHLVKLKAANLLKNVPHTNFQMNSTEQSIFYRCIEEVELLKSFLVDDNTSLDKLMHKNRNRRCAYVDNKKLKNLVGKFKITSKFPEYSVVITGCYNKAVTRKSFLVKATYVMREITKINVPDLCSDQIFVYLGNVDLLQFIEAFKNT